MFMTQTNKIEYTLEAIFQLARWWGLIVMVNYFCHLGPMFNIRLNHTATLLAALAIDKYMTCLKQ